MDFFNGPQIETCLYRSNSKDRFLIKVSQLVCDAAGVKEIAGEYDEAALNYGEEEIEEGEDYE